MTYLKEIIRIKISEGVTSLKVSHQLTRVTGSSLLLGNNSISWLPENTKRRRHLENINRHVIINYIINWLIN